MPGSAAANAPAGAGCVTRRGRRTGTLRSECASCLCSTSCLRMPPKVDRRGRNGTGYLPSLHRPRPPRLRRVNLARRAARKASRGHEDRGAAGWRRRGSGWCDAGARRRRGRQDRAARRRWRGKPRACGSCGHPASRPSRACRSRRSPSSPSAARRPLGPAATPGSGDRGRAGARPPAQGDRFAACAGFLGLLSNAARDRPLLLVVDDAHWLDPASAECLGFAARRLDDKPIAMLVAARTGERTRSSAVESTCSHCPGSTVRPPATCSRTSTRAPIRRRRVPGRRRRGNPLALIELPALLTPRPREESIALDEPLPPGRQPPAGVRRPHRATALAHPGRPARRRHLVHALARADPGRVWNARHRAGGARARRSAGIVRLSSERIEFGHPLLRGAVYRGAPPPSAGGRTGRWPTTPTRTAVRGISPPRTRA